MVVGEKKSLENVFRKSDKESIIFTERNVFNAPLVK